MIRIKLLEIDPDYDDEVNYFLDIFETFIDKNYRIRTSLELSEEYSKYYVSPNLYKSLTEICQLEINAIGKIDNKLKESVMNVRNYIKE